MSDTNSPSDPPSEPPARIDLDNPAPAHQLAGLAYLLVTGAEEPFCTRMEEVVQRLRESASGGESFELPRLATLLEDPEFEGLREVFETQGVVVDHLQLLLDQNLEKLVAEGANAGQETGGEGEQSPPADPLALMLQPLIRAASSGKDVEPILAALRSRMLAQNPDKASELDAFIGDLRTKIAPFMPD